MGEIVNREQQSPSQFESRFQPLWPFSSEAEAARWQQARRKSDEPAWQLDADRTALKFTQEFLGYANIDKVVGAAPRALDSGEARIDVGFDAPNGAPITAAVLHLARIGVGDDAPWEIVGAEGEMLLLDTPGYGAAVTSPLEVSGRITGVDESLTVQVRVKGRAEPAGEVSGIPAGGDNAPWSVQVPFTADPGSVLTVAVSSGGHIAEVEHFAITGARF